MISEVTLDPYPSESRGILGGAVGQVEKPWKYANQFYENQVN